ncbi:acyltransferase family protein [Companilactobacillus hulinensis]|uniref:acyltransferase family protein n=1 Tax=Companilactobacillus hulinensis TaxID=2486007 RepID=UPI000F7B9D57|nr:acyltransferase family protein [Companilactobacillus hulinensis]
MTKKRIDWIDVARCIAILSVVIGHTMAGLNRSYLYNLIYLYDLPVFFFLSGYLYHQKGYKKLLMNDIKFLLMPYLAVNAIKLVILAMLQHHIGTGIFTINLHSFQSLMIATLYGDGMNYRSFPAVNAIWFLMAMFVANQLFNLVMRINIGERTLAFQGFISLILTGLGFGIAHFVSLPLSINSALIAQFLLYMGYIFQTKNLLLEISKWQYVFLGVAALLVASFGTFYMDAATAPSELMAIAGSLAASLCVVKISMMITNYLNTHGWKKFERLMLFIGAQSLTVLCFHLLDLDCLRFYTDIIQGLSGKVPRGIPVLVGMVYRIIWAVGMTWGVRFIPVLRSFFMPRSFPMFKKQLKVS